MDKPNPQRYTTRDWVLGLIVFAALGIVFFALNSAANSHLPNPPWLRTMGTAIALVLGGRLIWERFSEQDR